MKTTLFTIGLIALFSFGSFGANQASKNSIHNEYGAVEDEGYIEPCLTGIAISGNVYPDSTGGVTFSFTFGYPFDDYKKGFEFLKVEWDFGDGKTFLGRPVQIGMGHLYENPGTYDVCVTVWSTNGTECCKTEECITVVINKTDPCRFLERFLPAQPIFEPNTFVAGGWRGKDFYSEDVKFHWDFGDGTSDDGLVTEHVYASAGTYTVKLTTFFFSDDREICCSRTEEITVISDGPGLAPEDGVDSNNGLSKDKSPLSLFPNPSTGEFTLNSSAEYAMETIDIYSQTGELVYSETLAESRFSKKLNLPELESGIYFVLVNAADEANPLFTKLAIE